ncbi:DUF6988 family protein [Pandoraea apista]|uniref:Uncharacterized protein n=1 Tax=Pandoraea apista TaxID=93218 RepID=A0ABX9ZHX5_9BURK|nr:hypothetical protein [Pandoraea apista]PTE00572.1 hypothetical protein C7830_13635 [Pandoraea apista]RRJ27433.1 hypothetical protein EIB05_21985 [Pandoraea apista]RRJ72932.1 hypothetical protein EIL82_23200 [Pandoraea apista]RSD07205.1 hypothetical protein EJB12_18415 [Pandoraea apista]RSD12154.1 hypothetical protein EIZ52_21110 [Pandoraea apista]
MPRNDELKSTVGATSGARWLVPQPLHDELSLAEDWVAQREGLLQAIDLRATARKRVFGTFQLLSLEHFEGVLALVSEAAYVPACSVYKAQFDAFTRGAWYRRCATDAQVLGFLRAEQRPPPSTAIARDLGESGLWGDRATKSAMMAFHANLCDVSHGGRQEVLTRIKADRFDDAHLLPNIAKLVRSAAYLSLLACREIVDSGKNERQMIRLRNAFEALYRPAPKRQSRRSPSALAEALA